VGLNGLLNVKSGNRQGVSIVSYVEYHLYGASDKVSIEKHSAGFKAR